MVGKRESRELMLLAHLDGESKVTAYYIIKKIETFSMFLIEFVIIKTSSGINKTSDHDNSVYHCVILVMIDINNISKLDIIMLSCLNYSNEALSLLLIFGFFPFIIFLLHHNSQVIFT